MNDAPLRVLSLDSAHDRAARSEIAAYALMVDAIDEIAVAFYKHHGFIALPDSPMALFLSLKTAAIVKTVMHGQAA